MGARRAFSGLNAPTSDSVRVVDVAADDPDGGLLVWSAPGVRGTAPEGEATLLGALPYNASGYATSGYATADGWWYVEWRGLEGWAYDRFLADELLDFCDDPVAEDAARRAAEAIIAGDVDALEPWLTESVAFSWVNDDVQLVRTPLRTGLFNYTQPGTGTRYDRPAAELIDLIGQWFVLVDRELARHHH